MSDYDRLPRGEMSSRAYVDRLIERARNRRLQWKCATTARTAGTDLSKKKERAA